MRTDLQSIGCGNCGCFKFFVYQIQTASRSGMKIAVECSKCKSVTVLRAEAYLEFDWGEEYDMKSEGRICPMDKKGKK